jgi:hypothetical protein
MMSDFIKTERRSMLEMALLLCLNDYDLDKAITTTIRFYESL